MNLQKHSSTKSIGHHKDGVDKILMPFIIDSYKCREIMNIMSNIMTQGLQKATNDKASIKMLPSFVTKIPSGNENGNFLALDLGGTNYRVLLVKLKPGRKPEVEEISYAIKKELMEGSGEQLFQYLAETIKEFLQTSDLPIHNEILLGFTFSFPCKQLQLNSAILMKWTKGFSAKNVVGKDVAKMLQEACNKLKLRVKCVAIVNDTVGTLTSCALEDPRCAIGLIVGTGTNAAYIEKATNCELFDGGKHTGEVIINCEWGAFGDCGSLQAYRTSFDDEIDKVSVNPGKQIFEKMISGMYLGELVRLVLLKLCKEKILFRGVMQTFLEREDGFPAKFISDIERDPPGLYYATTYILTQELNVLEHSTEDKHIIRRVCEAVASRSAALSGSGIACLLNRMGRNKVTVGVDGSLFRLHPKYAERMTLIIHELVTDIDFYLKLSEDGSGKGAAAIAATTVRH